MVPRRRRARPHPHGDRVTRLPTVQILAKDTDTKGHAFEATLVSYVLADGLWSGGEARSDTRRPVYAMLAGDETTMRFFLANVREGRKFGIPGDGSSKKGVAFEFLRSGGYTVSPPQRTSGGVVHEVYLPGLFRRDLGMVDPTDVAFIVLPPRWWLARSGLDVAPLRSFVARLWPEFSGNLVELVHTAVLFSAHLDRHTHAPLIADLRFYIQVFLAAVADGLAAWNPSKLAATRLQTPTRAEKLFFHESRLEAAKLLPGVAFKATQEEVKAMLALEVRRHLAMTRML